MVSEAGSQHCEAGQGLLLDTMGSPALGHGSNCRLWVFLSAWMSAAGRQIYVQCVFQMLVDLHYRGLVAAPVAVVGRCQFVSELNSQHVCTVQLTRKDGHDISILRPIVPLHHELMCPGNQGQSIVMVESL